MDLFDKCFEFTRADDIKARGCYPYFRPIEENEGPVVTIEGRKVIMAGSNNYLGLTAHPKVKEAAIEAVKKYGTGCSGSRYLTGTLDLHIMLEERLANFFNKEAVLLFSTGYMAAQGVVPTLTQRGEYVVTDKDNHASIWAGNFMARGAAVDLVRYKHVDYEDLERQLKKLPLDKPKLLISDGVFSTGGEIVDLPRLVELKKKYNARLLIDDAHSVGVIGVGGRGTGSEFGLEDEVDLQMGTFSKTFASLGGFVASKAKVIDYLKHHSSSLIFAASPTPAAVAAALAALDILEAEPERVKQLVDNAEYVRAGFKNEGFNVLDGRTGIVPIIVGDDELAFAMWKMLFEAGIFVNVFISPGVPPGRQMMRTSYMATHQKEHLDFIIETFKKVGKELNLI